MIISASRRSDIPAFYSTWFINRVRAGWCRVRNPFNASQVRDVSLRPQDVDAIVFWSKNPAPLMTYLDELDHILPRYLFQFTLNDYPPDLEPHLPPVHERIATFKQLSKRLGERRVLWRYDPIIISNLSDHRFHVTTFRRLAEQLASYTQRVTVSVLEWYKKTERNLSALETRGYCFEPAAANKPETSELIAALAEMATSYGMTIQTCAQRRDYSELKAPPGACIDGALLEELWGLTGPWKKDPGQRATCCCAVSRDIGVPDTCVHGCPYCYSTRSLAVARTRWATHDPSRAELVPSKKSKG